AAPVPEAGMTRATFPWRLLGIGAPMAVWALHFVAVYALQGLACVEGIHHARAWMVALALAACALLAWSGRRAWLAWHAALDVSPIAVCSLHYEAGYAQQGLACVEGFHHARAWMVALALAAWALLAWSGRRAWRAWHAARGGAPGAADARRRFAAAVTGALCVLAAVAIGFTTLPVMLLPGCAT